MALFLVLCCVLWGLPVWAQTAMLTWVPGSVLPDGSNAPTGFRIERQRPADSGFVEIGTDTASPYVDTTGLTNGQLVSYRVRAYNAGGNSAYSNTASAVIGLPQLATAVFCSLVTTDPTLIAAYNFS